MTTANPDALADARELIRQSLKVGAPGLSEAAREAVVRSIMLKLEGKVLAPILADLQRVTAERDEARAENDRFRAGLANGAGPCAYCNLSHEAWSKCRSGFPGCGRADDAMLCPHFGAEMEANDRADAAEAALVTANTELARRRAEGEALKGALTEIRDHPENHNDGRCSYAVGWAFWNIQNIARTALARAATAREGKADA